MSFLVLYFMLIIQDLFPTPYPPTQTHTSPSPAATPPSMSPLDSLPCNHTQDSYDATRRHAREKGATAVHGWCDDILINFEAWVTSLTPIGGALPFSAGDYARWLVATDRWPPVLAFLPQWTRYDGTQLFSLGRWGGAAMLVFVKGSVAPN